MIDAPTRELDIRGIRAIEVYEQVVAFLDEAALLGLTSVRVIHGKGTGALRDATREASNRVEAVSGPRPWQKSADDGTNYTFTKKSARGVSRSKMYRPQRPCQP